MKLGPDAFINSRILVIGDVMLDRYWWGTVSRISPEAPVPVVVHNETTVRPGGAANVAANINSLNAQPRLLGIVGNDHEGGLLIEQLDASGIVTDAIYESGDRSTNVKTRVIAHGQQVTRIDREDRHPLSDGEASQIKDRIVSEVPNCDLVIASDYAKGILSDEILQHLVRVCKEHNKLLLVDPKGKDYAKYQGAWLITPNRREAAEGCKLDENRTDVVEIAGRQMLDEFGFEHVLITEGPEGMTLFGRDGTLKVDANAHQVFDVTGAGDTVIATLGTALASGFDIAAAVELANRAAGIAVGVVGAAAVTADELFAGKSGIHRTVERPDG